DEPSDSRVSRFVRSGRRYGVISPMAVVPKVVHAHAIHSVAVTPIGTVAGIEVPIRSIVAVGRIVSRRIAVRISIWIAVAVDGVAAVIRIGCVIVRAGYRSADQRTRSKRSDPEAQAGAAPTPATPTAVPA